MPIVKATSDELNSFKFAAVNATVDYDERLRLENALYMFCTTLSVAMFVFVTSFAFLDANRPLVGSWRFVRMIDVNYLTKVVDTVPKASFASQNDASTMAQKPQEVLLKMYVHFYSFSLVITTSVQKSYYATYEWENVCE